MKDLNELSERIHADAVAHGYWEIKEPPTDTKAGLEKANLAKIHCELSEAIEQDCKGRPMVWYYCVNWESDREPDSCCLESGRENVACVGQECCKPEGIAVELADFVIAFMDYCRYKNIRFPPDGNDVKIHVLPNLVNWCHEQVCDLFSAQEYNLLPDALKIPAMAGLAAEIVLTVAGYVEWQGLDFWQIVAEKMEYNKKRPRLHGNRY